MNSREKLDLSAYIVIGPENIKNRRVAKVIYDVVEAGFTCVQIRSKTASATELIQLTKQAASAIEKAGKTNQVTLLVNDRLDVILAARMEGVKVDGIHVGQADIPVEVCRRYLGEDSVIGVTATTEELLAYIQTMSTSQIDYLGIGPLRETTTKPDCGLGADGIIITRSFDEIKALVKVSPLPLVVGGGVKFSDLPSLAQTGADGFFVVTAISEADDPKEAALEMVNEWRANKVSLC